MSEFTRGGGVTAERPGDEPTLEALKLQLDTARTNWAQLSAKRQRRASDYDTLRHTTGLRVIHGYNAAKAEYERLVIEYGRKELADKLANIEDESFQRLEIAWYWLEEQNRLREETKQTVEGKKTWKFVNKFSEFMNRGSRAERIAKGVMLGFAAGVVGSAVAATAGAAIVGTGVAMAARFGRGYAMRHEGGMEQTSVTAEEILGQIEDDDFDFDLGEYEDFIAQLHAKTSELYEADSKNEQKKIQRAQMYGLGTVALGAVMGEAFSLAMHASDIVTLPSASAAEIVNGHDVAGHVSIDTGHDMAGTMDGASVHSTSGLVDMQPTVHDVADHIATDTGHDMAGTIDGASVHSTSGLVDMQPTVHDVATVPTHDIAGMSDTSPSHITTGTVGTAPTHAVAGTIDVSGSHAVAGSVDTSGGHDIAGHVSSQGGHDVAGGIDTGHDIASQTGDATSSHDVAGGVDMQGGHDVAGHETTGDVDTHSGHDIAPKHTDGFTVEHGHGDTHELIDYAKENGVKLSPEEAWKLHVAIIDTLREHGGHGLVHGNYIQLADHAGSDAYSMGNSAYEVGIAAPSHNAHFTSGAQDIIDKFLDSMKTEHGAHGGGHTVAGSVDTSGGHDIAGHVSSQGGHDVAGGIDTGHDIASQTGDASSHEVAGGVDMQGGHDVAGQVDMTDGHATAGGSIDVQNGHDVAGTVDVPLQHDTPNTHSHHTTLPVVDKGEGLNSFVHDNYTGPHNTLTHAQSMELGKSLSDTGYAYSSDYLGSHYGNPYGISHPGGVGTGMNVQIHDMVEDGVLENYSLSSSDWSQIERMLQHAAVHGELPTDKVSYAGQAVLDKLGPELRGMSYADGTEIMSYSKGSWHFNDSKHLMPQRALDAMYRFLNSADANSAQALTKVLQ